MVDAILRELDIQQNYLHNAPLSSVYWGGGTPSLLPPADISRIFKAIELLHSIAPNAEITLEANPDDLTLDFLLFLKNETPVNRLSIGVQSFSEVDLQWMNRSHTAAQAIQCIEDARDIGFERLTIDLIYGAPCTTDAVWHDNLSLLFRFDVPHFSAYCLTVETNTALGRRIQSGLQSPPDETAATRHFQILLERAAAAGFVHYEISNFAKPGCYAVHNSGYWLGDHYLGIGPSAHSFNQISRQWNVANNAMYIKSLQAGVVPYEIEWLTPANRYNEYVLTALRTMWGCSWATIQAMGEQFAVHFQRHILPWVKQGKVIHLENDHFVLSDAGKWQADGIAADLFFLDN